MDPLAASGVSLRTFAAARALIRDRRRVPGIDQVVLAARIGVSRLPVGQVERGKAGASHGLVLRTLAAVGVEPCGRRYDPPDQPLSCAVARIETVDIAASIARGRRGDG